MCIKFLKLDYSGECFYYDTMKPNKSKLLLYMFTEFLITAARVEIFMLYGKTSFLNAYN